MLERIPPVLLRAESRTDCTLVIGVGAVGNLMVLVRLTDGLVAMYALVGSRADMLLKIVSVRLVSSFVVVIPAQTGHLDPTHRCGPRT